MNESSPSKQMKAEWFLPTKPIKKRLKNPRAFDAQIGDRN